MEIIFCSVLRQEFIWMLLVACYRKPENTKDMKIAQTTVFHSWKRVTWLFLSKFRPIHKLLIIIRLIYHIHTNRGSWALVCFCYLVGNSSSVKFEFWCFWIQSPLWLKNYLNWMIWSGIKWTACACCMLLKNSHGDY